MASVSLEEYQKLIEENKDLQQQLDKSKVKTEEFFQRLLEDRYKAKHQKTKLGVTDLTNENFNSEIKEWESYKSG